MKWILHGALKTHGHKRSTHACGVTEEKKLLNKVVNFVFFVHKMFSRSNCVEPLMSHGLFSSCAYYLSGH